MTSRFFIHPPRAAARRLPPAVSFALFAAGVAAVLLASEGFDLVDGVRFQLARRDVHDPGFRAAVVVVAYLLGSLSVAVLCAHRWAPARWLGWGSLGFGLAATLGWRSVNGVGIRLHEAALFWSELPYASEALSFFAPRWLGAAAGAVVGTAALAVLARRLVPRIRPAWVLVLPLLAGLVSWDVVQTTFGKVQQLPSPYRIVALLAYAHRNQVPYYGPREEPYLEPVREPAASHLILIVDESVSGDLLGVNGGPAGTTPFLDSLGSRLWNYGVIPSIANVSATTNIVLQSGLRPDQLPDRELRSLRAPNVFAYMKRAGFSTFYVDGQTYGPPSNFMTRFDIDELDGFVQMIPLELGSLSYEIDHRMIPRLAEIVSSHARSFTYVLKAGAHLHYEGHYPDRARVFEPTLRDGELEFFNLRGADRERTVNSYLNDLRWTVDDFWAHLLPALEGTGRDVLVVYTSDHGQSLLEIRPSTGEPEWLSHNTVEDPPVFQAMVPLLLVGLGDRAESWLSEHVRAELAGRVSQFSVFPTLLEMAGYEPARVRALYGPGIFDPAAASDDRFFVSGDPFGQREFGLNPYRPEERPRLDAPARVRR